MAASQPPATYRIAPRIRDGREAAHLDVGREADPELLRVAALAPLGLLCPQRLVVDDCERLVERCFVVARVDREPGGNRRRELLDEVLPAQLDRVHVELPRQRVDRTLDRVGRLGPAGAAVGVGRRRVRVDAHALEVVALDGVAAAVEPGAEDRDARRHELEVRAHRSRQPHPHRGDRPVGGRRELHLLDDVASVDGGDVRLRAPLDPLDRPAELPREREAERLLGVDVQLRAEPAADVRGDDPQLRLGDAGDEREGRAEDVRDLGRRPHRVLALSGDGLHDHAARLDRVRDQPVLVVALLHRHRRLGEQPLGLSRLELPRVAVVRAQVVVQDRGVVAERSLDVAHRRQLLVVDLDELGGVLGERPAVRDHDRDAVAGVARLVDRERPVRRQLDVLGDGPGARQPARPLVGEVGAGERRDDALGLACGREVDARGSARARTGLRTTAIQTMPAIARSSTKRAWPVRSSGSSLRATGEPMYVCFSVTAITPPPPRELP